MSIFWPEPEVGPRTTRPAQVALAGAQDAVAVARRELAAGADVRWVSVAADRYRALVTDALGDVGRLGAAVGEAWGPVLRHTRASDDARAAHEVEAANLWLLPGDPAVWAGL